ncbi:MAG: YnbE family lipoprotein [Xanthomonadales bacterium]|nr:YnbE family lipoprotein [Xanthomonadales bacterium]
MTRLIILVWVILVTAIGCTPTVKVQAPDKPIEINMNINIKHEILVKVERDVEKLLLEDEDLF